MKNGSTPNYFNGLEIGSVSVKWVRINNQENPITKIIRHEGNPIKKISQLFDNISLDSEHSMVVTGRASKRFIDFPYKSETECIEKSLEYYQTEPDILLALGGESFSVYTLNNGVVKNIVSSSKCAAGTGEFLVQQFKRMNFSLEEGINAWKNGKHVPLATRCSVHCKSDATHKLNKGECNPNDIARSLIADLSAKIIKLIDSVEWPKKTIVISGGLSLNHGLIEELKKKLPDSKLVTFSTSPCLEAFGAALYAQKLKPADKKNISLLKNLKPARQDFHTLPSLSDSAHLLDYRADQKKETGFINGEKYILGVDAGSTTTKAILYDIKNKRSCAGCYLRTHGNPIEATRKCIVELSNQTDGVDIDIIQTAVTGSGREMVSVFLDNALSFNEILTHARAASEEVPEIDTLFEIGGQDSKFISYHNSVPVDYAMNEGCSAGTGSFLEESISVDMGIPTEEISKNAEAGTSPVAFGERCAAFINTDLRNALQKGAKKEDAIAGLVYSIADNYISRIVGVRQIGKTLLFQGGVALNKSVALAIAYRTQKKVVVPENPELMGCIGGALMAMDLLKVKQIEEKNIRLDKYIAAAMEVQNSFICKTCENKCEIQKVAVGTNIYPFGGLCSKYDISRRNKKINKGKNLLTTRNNLMFKEFGAVPVVAPRGRIGIPASLSTFEFFPFYAGLINAMGFDVVLSEPSKEGNAKTKSIACYPCEAAHGAVWDLMQKQVDFIFMPRFIEDKVQDGYLHAYTCAQISGAPDLLCNTFKGLSKKMLSPHTGFSERLRKLTLNEIVKMGKTLGLSKAQSVQALKKATSHYNNFISKRLSTGENILRSLKNEPTIILAGRAYSTYSPEINLSIDKKIVSRGYNVIPADMIPPQNTNIHKRNMWFATQQMLNAIEFAKKHTDVYVSVISCFSCSPDSSMLHLIREELSEEIFCYLEIDSHTAHAGFETRIGAFLDIIENKKQINKPAA